MNSKEKITAIILSGGKSTRMGTEKGLTKLNGKFLIEHIVDVVKKVTDEIIIVANSSDYDVFGYKVFSDIIKNCGPMGGIYTGLYYSKTKKNIVLSCDIPFVSSEAVKYILDNSENSEITVPVHNDKLESLCAVYKKQCAEKLKLLLTKKIYKMTDAIKYFKLKTFDVSEQKFYSEKLFSNINSKNELLKAQEFANEN